MSIFVGLVTHKNSTWASGPHYKRLKSVATELSSDRELFITNENPFSTESIPSFAVILRPFLVLWSLWETRVFRQTPLAMRVKVCIREFAKEVKLLLESGSSQRILRNRNITQAHLQIWSKGLQSSKDCIAVFEDDVEIDGRSLAEQVTAAIKKARKRSGIHQGFALFLSESFSLETHGLPTAELSSSKLGEYEMVSHNTVGWCDTVAATVYSRDFLEYLENFFQNIPSLFLWTIPVDWLVDLAIQQSAKESPLQTFHLIPGLCRQRSMNEHGARQS